MYLGTLGYLLFCLKLKTNTEYSFSLIFEKTMTSNAQVVCNFTESHTLIHTACLCVLILSTPAA